MSPNATEQLQKVAASGETPYYMTGQEGQELLAAGLIQAHADQAGPVPGSCRVTLTEAGQQAVSQNGSNDSKPKISEPTVGVAIPVAPKRATKNLTPRKTEYPFDDLVEPTTGPDGSPLFGSFHVTVSDPSDKDAIKKLKQKMSSAANAAHNRYSEEVKDEAGNVVTEAGEKKTMKKDDQGNPILNTEGKRQYDVQQVMKPKTQRTRQFLVREVNSDDPQGPGVRVFRVPLGYNS